MLGEGRGVSSGPGWQGPTKTGANGGQQGFGGGHGAAAGTQGMLLLYFRTPSPSHPCGVPWAGSSAPLRWEARVTCRLGEPHSSKEESRKLNTNSVQKGGTESHSYSAA